MDTTPILSQGLRFIPVARGEFLCIGERVEILGRWDDSARGMEIRSSSRSEMHGMLIKKRRWSNCISIVISISDFRAMRSD